MRVSGFKRNPRATKKAVDQFGFVDIVSVMTNNSLPAVTAEGADAYNGIEDPASILGKPHDVFEAMAMQSAINEYKAPDASGEPKVVE